MKITSRFCFFFFLIFASTFIFAGDETCPSTLMATDSCRSFANTTETECEQYCQTSGGVNYCCKMAENSGDCISSGGTWEGAGNNYACTCPGVDNVPCTWNDRNCDGYQGDEQGC